MTTETTDKAYMVTIHFCKDGEITTDSHKFTNEALAEKFAFGILGAETPKGEAIGTTVFRVLPNGESLELNQFEY